MTARKAKGPVTLKDGTLLDDETVDHIIDEVEDAVLAGRGVTSFPRKGRPSLTGRAAVSPHVGFRVSPELRDEAEAIARARGVTVSALAREALEEYVRKAG
jgi:predicted DNA-binding protein